MHGPVSVTKVNPNAPSVGPKSKPSGTNKMTTEKSGTITSNPLIKDLTVIDDLMYLYQRDRYGDIAEVEHATKDEMRQMVDKLDRVNNKLYTLMRAIEDELRLLDGGHL